MASPFGLDWSTGEQEHTLQLGLDLIKSYLHRMKITVPVEKAEYVLILNGQFVKAEAIRKYFSLSMVGQPIQRKFSIRVLEAYIDQDGKSTSSVKKVSSQCKSSQHLIRRVANIRWGTKEKETRQIIRAIHAFSTAAIIMFLPADNTSNSRLTVGPYGLLPGCQNTPP
ncbi:hypothetical protein HPB48_003695 [Haemaphysalis longicornis]|uniref:Uncharacterized protein n=1 Tax=Haemaphysalis longicornis TaxID=44386 RepID=A0A9J6FHI1_HAELO|nr:hypothetical protein HPB48_003695 [Haemaphysalis longicornis]